VSDIVGERLLFVNNLNEKAIKLGKWLTNKVGTMWCAFLFAILAITGFPEQITRHSIVDWLIQDFLQLVLMSVILVGQDVQSEIAKKELEELRSLSTDIRRIISELEARQSLKAISLETGRQSGTHISPEQNTPMG